MKKPMKNTTTSSMFPTLSPVMRRPMTIYTTMFRSFPCISSTGSSLISTRCIPIPNTGIYDNNRIFQTAVTYRNHIDTFSTSNCTFSTMLRSNCFHTFSVRPMHSLLSPRNKAIFPTLSHPIVSNTLSTIAFVRTNHTRTYSMHSPVNPIFPTLSHPMHPISSTIQYVLPSRFESLACISPPKHSNTCFLTFSLTDRWTENWYSPESSAFSLLRDRQFGINWFLAVFPYTLYATQLVFGLMAWALFSKERYKS